METYSLTHGLKDGTRVTLWEAPLWAILLERYWPAGPTREPLATVWWHITQRVFRATHRRYKETIQIPVTDEESNIIAPGAFDWVSDSEPPLELGTPVRLVPRPETLDRPGMKGHIVAVHIFNDEKAIEVAFENGAYDTFRPDQLIDIRLISER